ncbi:MAG TPA: hypothetical protein VGP93_14120 [Polyangiaceae bacterium]|nr:hypothetical protein [Polyangiaceae bacterium]
MPYSVPDFESNELVRCLQLSAEMPVKKTTIDKAKKALRQGKSPSTAAGEFIRDEIDRMRHGEHGAHSTKQAIAIGLAKARRAGVPLRPQPESSADERSRRSVEHAYEVGQRKRKRRAARPSATG